MQFLIKDIQLTIMLGSTHYVDTGQPRPAVIYYQTAETAFIRFPDGNVLEGEWNLTDAGYHIAWQGGPSAAWRIAHQPGRFWYVDETGAERGDITMIVPGDAENLAD